MDLDRKYTVLQVQSGEVIWYINTAHVVALKIDAPDLDSNPKVTFHMINTEKITLEMKGHEVDMLRTYYQEIAEAIKDN